MDWRNFSGGMSSGDWNARGISVLCCRTRDHAEMGILGTYTYLLDPVLAGGGDAVFPLCP